MEINIKIEGRKTIVTHNGKSMDIKTAFIKKLKVNDFIEYIKEKLS